MRLFVDVEKGRFVQAPGVGIVPRPFQFKRGDGGLLEIEFLRGLSVVDLGADFAVKFGVKLPGQYDEDPLVFHETFEKVGTVYVGEPSFNTVALNAALEKDSDPENDVDSVDVILEVTWSIDAGLTWLSTDTVRGVIFNDVVRGDETLPVRGYQQVVQATNVFTVFADADVGAMLLSFDRGGIYSPTGVFFSSTGTYDQDEAATALAGLINDGDHGVTAEAAGPYVTVTATDLGPDGNGILCGISTGSEFGEWTYTETRGGTEGLVLRAIEQALTDEEKTVVKLNLGVTEDLENFQDLQLTPIISAGVGSPFSDPDAEAVISSTGITSDPGKLHYRRLIKGLKALDVWDDVECGFLFGSNHQTSAATIQPFKGANTASGTGTNNADSVTLNGTSDGYLVTNANPGTAETGKTLIALYDHDFVSQPDALISNYSGGVIKGMAMHVAGDAIGTVGSGVLDNVYGYASIDGAANTVIPSVNLGSENTISSSPKYKKIFQVVKLFRISFSITQ